MTFQNEILGFSINKQFQALTPDEQNMFRFLITAIQKMFKVEELLFKPRNEFDNSDPIVTLARHYLLLTKQEKIKEIQEAQNKALRDYANYRSFRNSSFGSTNGFQNNQNSFNPAQQNPFFTPMKNPLFSNHQSNPFFHPDVVPTNPYENYSNHLKPCKGMPVDIERFLNSKTHPWNNQNNNSFNSIIIPGVIEKQEGVVQVTIFNVENQLNKPTVVGRVDTGNSTHLDLLGFMEQGVFYETKPGILTPESLSITNINIDKYSLLIVYDRKFPCITTGKVDASGDYVVAMQTPHYKEISGFLKNGAFYERLKIESTKKSEEVKPESFEKFDFFKPDVFSPEENSSSQTGQNGHSVKVKNSGISGAFANPSEDSKPEGTEEVSGTSSDSHWEGGEEKISFHADEHQQLKEEFEKLFSAFMVKAFNELAKDKENLKRFQSLIAEMLK